MGVRSEVVLGFPSFARNRGNPLQMQDLLVGKSRDALRASLKLPSLGYKGQGRSASHGDTETASPSPIVVVVHPHSDVCFECGPAVPFWRCIVWASGAGL